LVVRFVSYEEMKSRIIREFGTLQKQRDDLHDTTKHFRIPGFRGRLGKNKSFGMETNAMILMNKIAVIRVYYEYE